MRFKSLLALGDPKSFCHVYLYMSMRRWKLSDPPLSLICYITMVKTWGVSRPFIVLSVVKSHWKDCKPEFVDYRLSPDHWRWTQAVILLLLCLVQQTLLCVFLHVCPFSINKINSSINRSLFLPLCMSSLSLPFAVTPACKCKYSSNFRL